LHLEELKEECIPLKRAHRFWFPTKQ